MKTIIFLKSLLSTSIRSSISVRSAFLLETILMIGNNLLFFSLWWIFFQQFVDVGGWKINDLAAAMAMLCGSYGLMNICFGGFRTLGLVITNGDLDPFMVQPKNLLLHILGSKSRSKGWGNIISTGILFFLGGYEASSLFLMLALIISGTIIYTASTVIIHSLSFWFGSIEGVSNKYLDSIFIFALYPTNIYSGVVQLMMFTVIPAGLIGYLPVELLRNFSWIGLALLFCADIIFVMLALLVFHKGLKNYQSGNKFGTRL